MKEGGRSIFSLIPYEQLDGLVVATNTLKDDSLKKELLLKSKEAGIPMITINGAIEGCYNVILDYREAMEQIVRHVVRVHGCRRVNWSF